MKHPEELPIDCTVLLSLDSLQADAKRHPELPKEFKAVAYSTKQFWEMDIQDQGFWLMDTTRREDGFGPPGRPGWMREK